jgi:hypothetical protein
MKAGSRRKHPKQNLHFLNEDGTVACNPRGREAAHRARVEGIATENPHAVTCRKCKAAIRKTARRKYPASRKGCVHPPSNAIREAPLRDFSLGSATVAELRDDLNAALIDQGIFQRQAIEDMSDDYLVTCQDLDRLCDAVLADDMAPLVLEPIGFCLIASDHFAWDAEDPGGEIVAETIAGWSAPVINYPLNLENVRMFRDRLMACVSKNRKLPVKIIG